MSHDEICPLASGKVAAFWAPKVPGLPPKWLVFEHRESMDQYRETGSRRTLWASRKRRARFVTTKEEMSEEVDPITDIYALISVEIAGFHASGLRTATEEVCEKEDSIRDVHDLVGVAVPTDATVVRHETKDGVTLDPGSPARACAGH
jgi:hypothetical protein